KGLESVGLRRGWASVQDQAAGFRAAAERAVALLDAPRVKGGTYPVVLDPELAGVFIHEAFGHLSEADFIFENPQAREMMTLGRRFGKPALNAGDNGAAAGLRGTLPFDDEGTPTQDTPLIREGILVGRLHSRETAAKLGEPPTGNARAISFRHPPIVRMTNTYIAGGRGTFEDLIKDIPLGVYACGAFGGQTMLESFSFTAAYGHMIRDGGDARRGRAGRSRPCLGGAGRATRPDLSTDVPPPPRPHVFRPRGECVARSAGPNGPPPGRAPVARRLPGERGRRAGGGGDGG